MKSKMNTKNYLFKIISIVLIFSIFSCTEQFDEQLEIENHEIPPHIISKLEAAGFNTKNIVRKNDNYFVEGDIILSQANIESLLIRDSKLRGQNEEHYVTNNLVTGEDRIINISIDPNFNQIVKDAFETTIARYNALNLKLKFQPTPIPQTVDIMIFKGYLMPSGLWGKAQFPSNGNPGKEIYLNANIFHDDMSELLANYAESVISHEIGHALGFRHTDYLDPSNCGNNDSEGDPFGDGANHVEGTPTGNAHSWMNSCVSQSNADFTSIDIIALQNVYGKYHISGNNLISTTESYVEMNDVPDRNDVWVSWEVVSHESSVDINNLLVSSVGFGSVASLQAKTPFISGGATLTFTVNINNEESIVKSYDLWIGKPMITKRNEELGTCYDPWQQYNAPKLEGVTYTWTVSSNNINPSGYDEQCFIDANIPDGTTENFMLTLTMTNDETGYSTFNSVLGSFYQPNFCDCSPASPSCGGNGIPGNQQ